MKEELYAELILSRHPDRHEEVSKPSEGSHLGMFTPSGSTQWRWESKSEGDLVLGLPSEMVGGCTGDGGYQGEDTGDSLQRQDLSVPIQGTSAEEWNCAPSERQGDSQESRSDAENPCLSDKLSAGHSSEEPAVGGDNQGPRVSLQQDSDPAHCEEGGPHSGQVVLEVHGETVPIFRMGSRGGEASAEEGTSGERGRGDAPSRDGGASREREMMVQQTMAAAEERHLSLMQEERSRHQQEMEYMKNQMFWLSAIAGEERMGEVYNNPMLQQETMLRAVQLRKKRMEEELAAAQNDPGASSSM